MKTAMILAAGRGERLRPFTDHTPKALCKVNGVPLIEHHVINLANAGFEKLVINHAHLGGQIRQCLGNGKRFGVEICYSPEPPGGLETGGGIVKALPLLGNEPFIVVNADIYTDFDFKGLLHKETEYLHLILVPKNPSLEHYGDFGLVNKNQVSNSPLEYTFPGIACYNPGVFAKCESGRYSVAPLIRRFVEEHKVTGELHIGYWFDIGSFERLEAANRFKQA